MAGSQLHVIDANAPRARSTQDALAMAVVAQANLAQLRTAEARRRAIDSAAHDIRVLAPGPVTAFRDALIDYRLIQSYTDAELHLRLHEVWGHFCLFCWALGLGDPQGAPPLGSHKAAVELHCASALELKAAEVEGYLWRLRFEQRFRTEPDFRRSPGFDAQHAVAKKIPVIVQGKPVGACDASALLAASCEHAGMLAAVRWIADARLAWGAPGIMDVDESAYTGAA